MHPNHTENGQAATVGLEHATRLRAIADHLEQHPTLAPVSVNVHDNELHIRGYHHWIVNAAVLLQWADSIHADHLDVRPIDGKSCVYACGLLMGGRPVLVWTTVDGFAE
jgi:hypothetical protein